ncbi:TolC family protein, partial [Sphingomonas sp. 37zxx]|uniref:TolC family protein n=1 Tax=Sphingomonas sp. 37zxx TaxID=1550073 RepID=UPI001E549F3D
ICRGVIGSAQIADGLGPSGSASVAHTCNADHFQERSRSPVDDRDAAALARERYARGLDSFLTVIDAERTANTSRSAAIEAQGDAARTRIALYRAVGGQAPPR